MSQVLVEVLSAYFDKAPVGEGPNRQPSEAVTPADAEAMVASLTPGQRGTLDQDIIGQLHVVMDKIQDRRSPEHAGWAEKSPLVTTLRSADPARRAAGFVTLVTIEALTATRLEAELMGTPRNYVAHSFIRAVVNLLGETKMRFDVAQTHSLLDSTRDHLLHNKPRGFGFSGPATHAALTAIEQNLGNLQLSDDEKDTMNRVRETLTMSAFVGKSRERISFVNQILGLATSPLWDGEPWTKAINESVNALPPDQQTACTRLLNYAGTCNLTKPSKPWLKAAEPLLKALPADVRTPLLVSWLRQFTLTPYDEPERPLAGSQDRWKAYSLVYGHKQSNRAHLIGVMGLALLLNDPAVATVMADLAEHVGKLPREARESCAPLGTAAVRVLGAADDDASLAHLARLEMRIRWPKLKKVVKKQLDDTIKRRGLDRAEVEETLVPDFGLKSGVAELPFDGVTAVVTLGRSDKPSLAWKVGDKTARTIPAALKAKNPDAAVTAKQVVTDIEKMRGAQRTRLDLLFRRPRTWTYPQWRERYLDHGLVGSLARRLIWIVGDTPVIWRDGLVDVAGQPQSPADDAQVRLWHPAERPVDEVVAWRNALETWEISQPFKQAHREIYLLTDAERRTATYSNRFAAHIMRAMTLLSISQVRQWKSGLFGGQSSPSFDLSDYGLRAEWWMEMAGDETTPYGSPVYLASDQVRFTCSSDDSARRYGHTGMDQPLPLERVPLLAFTEVMRDVDLFVALASVGNDPNWSDGGPTGRFRNYWHSYSFGDLTESAKTRKAALERLAPRLAIRDRLSLSDKFLVVRGDIRTYKIHLGSGNILMEPNDQYLCIVPDSRAANEDGKVFLPFEGDKTLSIILSKAFLLAADTKISDATITRQIK